MLQNAVVHTYCYPTDLKSWVIEFTHLTTEIKTKSCVHEEMLALNKFIPVQTKIRKGKAGLTLGLSIKVVSVQSSQTIRIKVKVRYSGFYNQRRQGDPKEKKTQSKFCLFQIKYLNISFNC